MWIYKHAFFRRDEPELLHALKRKTNQHGAAARMGGGAGLGVGDGGADDMMMVDRAPIVGGGRCDLAASSAVSRFTTKNPWISGSALALLTTTASSSVCHLCFCCRLGYLRPNGLLCASEDG